MKTRVVVIDDHQSIRQMIARILTMDGHYELVGDSGSGLDGLRLCRLLKPRVAIIDLMLPELSGIELLRSLRDELRDTRVLIYSGSLNNSTVLSALQARPHGFVHKEDSLATLLEALRAVAAGGSYLTPFAVALSESAGKRDSLLACLCARERIVLQLVAEGCSSKIIGDRIGVSGKTIEHYRTAIMQKLDIHDVAGLTRFAIREGLVQLE